MKKKNCLACFLAIALFLGGLTGLSSFAAPELSLKAGDKVASIRESDLHDAGYQVIDDRDARILYTWPYTLTEYDMTSDTAYQNTLTFQAGQVSAVIRLEFTGTYIAVAFAETYYAAEVIITIDGEERGRATPHNPSAPKEGAGDSKIVFIQDDLEPGSHVIQISHQAAHTTGEDNVKGDGNAYYDNDAMFDCFFVRDQNRTDWESVTEGSLMSLYTEDLLSQWGLKAIDNTDEDILYAWPYDLESAVLDNSTAYGGTLQTNCGQVSGSFCYDFEGTFLAAAFAETYYACTIYIDIDGELVGEVTPHVNIPSGNPDTAYQSKVFFVKDDLEPGSHTVTITHEAAYTTGEDNIKADGVAYYDNNAMFDCFLVQSNPEQVTPKPPVSATPGDGRPSNTPSPPASTEKPAAEPGFFTTGIILALAAIALAAAGAVVLLVLRKRKKGKDRK